MDLEHPLITQVLKTGDPNKKVSTAMDTSQNTHLDYIKESEESQMNLIKLMEDIKTIYEIMEANHGVVASRSDHNGHNFQLFNVDDFIRESEGYALDIDHKKEDEEFHRASFTTKKITCFILLEDDELAELEREINE